MSENKETQWVMSERLRPQIPERVFAFLCRFPRGWMLIQPFRWMLFEKVKENAEQILMSDEPLKESGENFNGGGLSNTPNKTGQEADGPTVLKPPSIPLTEEEQRITDEVRRVMADAGPYRPQAIFDEQLDCIRVEWRDCSITEERINRWLTLCYDNYPDGQTALVGFNLKGIAHAMGVERALEFASAVDSVIQGAAH